MQVCSDFVVARVQEMTLNMTRLTFSKIVPTLAFLIEIVFQFLPVKVYRDCKLLRIEIRQLVIHELDSRVIEIRKVQDRIGVVGFIFLDAARLIVWLKLNT